MLKKITQLAMAIGALMAFVIPVAASADAWTLNGVSVGTSTAEGVTVDGTGSLSMTIKLPNGVPIEFGPCVVHYHGTVWNEEEEELVGDGEIDEFTITTDDICEVWIHNGPGGTRGTTLCDITGAWADTEPSWTLATSGTVVAIEGFNWVHMLNEGCALSFLSGMSGSLTGLFSGSSISLDGSADDVTHISSGGTLDLDGSLGITPTAGGTLTLD